jgi:hypothetical protein
MNKNEDDTAKSRSRKESFTSLSIFLVVLVMAIVGILLFNYFNTSSTKNSDLAASASPPNQNASLYFSPGQHSIAPNTSFTVQVRENSGLTRVNAVEADLTYPMDKLTFISTDATTSPFTIEAQNGGGEGKVTIGRGIIGSLTGDQLVASITFKTNDRAGNAQLKFSDSAALVSVQGNTNIIDAKPLKVADYTIK